MRRWWAVFLVLAGPAYGQTLTIPSEVDYGAAGLVSFTYECPLGVPCRARCFSNDALIMDRTEVQSVLMTAFRTHGRQNAPNFVVTISPRDTKAGVATVHLTGQGACAFDGLVAKDSSGFLSRMSREKGR